MIHAHTKPSIFSLVVLDFETTGLSPQRGDRCIEVGAVKIEAGQVTEHFQSLMHPGRRVSSFIENYTGISNAMLSEAPPIAEVMPRLAHFIGDLPILAHNASFDRRFLEAEYARLNWPLNNPFLCSMKLARRMIPESPRHGLEALVKFCRIQAGQHHRALSDAQMTAEIFLLIVERIQRNYPDMALPLSLMQQLSTLPKAQVTRFLAEANP